MRAELTHERTPTELPIFDAGFSLVMVCLLFYKAARILDLRPHCKGGSQRAFAARIVGQTRSISEVLLILRDRSRVSRLLLGNFPVAALRAFIYRSWYAD